jgi:transposase
VDRVEILVGVERRRRWAWTDKLRIVAEVDSPGAVFAAVARRHDISRGQLWNWRRQIRSVEAVNSGPSVPGFVPVCLMPEPALTSPAHGPVTERRPPLCKPERSASTRLEISLPNGAQVRVDGMVDAALLKAAIAAVRG